MSGLGLGSNIHTFIIVAATTRSQVPAPWKFILKTDETIFFWLDGRKACARKLNMVDASGFRRAPKPHPSHTQALRGSSPPKRSKEVRHRVPPRGVQSAFGSETCSCLVISCPRGHTSVRTTAAGVLCKDSSRLLMKYFLKIFKARFPVDSCRST